MKTGETPQRPSDFDEKLKNLKFQYAMGGFRFNQSLSEIEDLIDGHDPDGLRDQFYSDWTDADLTDLVAEARQFEKIDPNDLTKRAEIKRLLEEEE